MCIMMHGAQLANYTGILITHPFSGADARQKENKTTKIQKKACYIDLKQKNICGASSRAHLTHFEAAQGKWPLKKWLRHATAAVFFYKRNANR